MSNHRKKCLDVKGEQCVECDAGEGIEVHHLDGDRNNNALDNLIPLCRHCHSKLHRSGLNGLEEHLKPVEERSHIDQSKTTYGFECDRGAWNAWKDTVPRSKSLETRLNELIRADAAGNVIPAEVYDELQRGVDQRDWDVVKEAIKKLENPHLVQ